MPDETGVKTKKTEQKMQRKLHLFFCVFLSGKSCVNIASF